MIYCQLKEILANLPETEQASYRAHARQTGVGWQQFWMLLHNESGRVSLKNLQKIRDYLAPRTERITPGQIRFYLDSLIEARGLTQTRVSAEAGVSFVTVNRIANNLMRYTDFDVMDRLCAYLELDSLEQLLDTGELLVWREEQAVSEE